MNGKDAKETETVSDNTTTLHAGIIVKYDAHRGYGFTKPSRDEIADGGNVFFHVFVPVHMFWLHH